MKKIPRKLKKRIKTFCVKRLNKLKIHGVFQFGLAKLNKHNKAI